MAFHEIRFPMDIAWGSKAGPSYKTFVMPLPSGDEQRIGFWSKGRKKWQITKENLKVADVKQLDAFFRARKGKLFGFRMRDWQWWKIDPSTPEALPLLTSTTAQLQFVYPDSINAETEKITKPVLSVNVNNNTADILYSPDIVLYTYSGGTYTVYATMNYTLDRTTGIITATGASLPANLYWSGSYDWPVRFDTDDAQFVRQGVNMTDWSSIDMIQIRQ